MKLCKIQQIMPLLQNLMESYNVFTNVEALERKAEAWFEKLEGNDLDIISNVIKNWSGTKMPSSVDVLKKCIESKVFNKNEKTANSMICEYGKIHNIEDECEISRSHCENNAYEKKDFNLMNIELNGKVYMVCYWHKRRLQATFENNPYAKSFVDNLLLFKNGSTNNDINAVTNTFVKKTKMEI